MDLDGIQRTIVGRVSWFGRLVCCSLDNSMTRLVEGVFAHLGVHRGWMNLGGCLW